MNRSKIITDLNVQPIGPKDLWESIENREYNYLLVLVVWIRDSVKESFWLTTINFENNTIFGNSSCSKYEDIFKLVDYPNERFIENKNLKNLLQCCWDHDHESDPLYYKWMTKTEYLSWMV